MYVVLRENSQKTLNSRVKFMLELFRKQICSRQTLFGYVPGAFCCVIRCAVDHISVKSRYCSAWRWPLSDFTIFSLTNYYNFNFGKYLCIFNSDTFRTSSPSVDGRRSISINNSGRIEDFRWVVWKSAPTVFTDNLSPPFYRHYGCKMPTTLLLEGIINTHP
jgi:hypothetical protein